MPEYLIRADEGCAPDPSVLWDSVHQDIEGGTEFVCDWLLASAPNNVLNAGGLQSIAALATAVYLLLFTDAYVPPTHPLAYLADGDNRGWWGDGIDVDATAGEQPLGSWLWLLGRAPLVVAGMPIEQWAQSLALQALAPLQTQGVVAKIVATATVITQYSRVDLSVQLYGSDGTLMFDQDFELVWQQIATAPVALQ
jgi:phage gp46-like protein